MQKVITILLFILSVGVSVSWINNVSQKPEWSEWQQSNCYKHLSIRFKKEGYNKFTNKWNWVIQFKNSHEKQIHFTYEVSHGENEEGYKAQRLSIMSGKMMMSNTSLKTNGKLWITVDRMRIGTQSGDYYNCDVKKENETNN